MFCRSLADAISSCHGWPSKVVCTAQWWHLGSPKSACIELWILLQHHCHCQFVPYGQVGISNLLAHQWIRQTSLWCLLAHRHGLVWRSCHLTYSLCSLRTSWGGSCVLHLLVPICPWQHSPLCPGCRADNQVFPQPWSCKILVQVSSWHLNRWKLSHLVTGSPVVCREWYRNWHMVGHGWHIWWSRWGGWHYGSVYLGSYRGCTKSLISLEPSIRLTSNFDTVWLRVH